MAPEQHRQAEIRLKQLHVRIEAWRQTRPRYARMPSQFWEEALALATKLGIATVQQTLALNRDSLLRRLDQSDERAIERGEEPAFVELRPTSQPSPAGLVLEMENDAGLRMTLRLPSAQAFDVAHVIAAFRGSR